MKNRYILSLIALLAAVCLVFGACKGDKNDPSQNNTSSGTSLSDESGGSEADSGSTESDNDTVESSTNPDKELIEEIYGENPSYPYITLESDNSSVAPGESVNVSLKINNAQNLACFDLIINYDSSVFSLSEYEEANISSFYFDTFDSGEDIRFSGFTSRTVDFNGETVITLTLTAKADVSAESSVISASATQFMIGTDDSGDVIADLTVVESVAGECTVAIAE
ncbi:MAG: hypothetical protein J1E34_09780 [Oscillospiraceae bacterium]|nr:hypothetical protein [Oscillospiraceae bacterium]